MGNITSRFEVGDLLRPIGLLILFLTLYGVRVVHRVIKVRGDLAKIGNLPGTRFMYGPYTILGRLLPTIPYISHSGEGLFTHNHRLHEKYGSDVITSAFLFNTSSFLLLLADAAVVKEVTTNRLEFPKPLEMYKPVCIFGPSLVAVEFDEWKRHRRIAAPSFSEKNNRMVYEETTRITAELFDLWSTDAGGQVVKVENAVELTSRLALMVISAAGFGSRFGWNDMDEPPKGHEMTFQKALHAVMNNVMLRLILSDRILRLWEHGREVIVAFKELRVYMNEMVDDRRQSSMENESLRADLFTNLIKGTSSDPDEKGADHLSDEELIGNIFIFLFAGHETTAHSLGFTLALLATHQHIQEKAFAELRKIVPQGDAPTYSQIVKWTYGLAITYESMRMYPPVINFPKYAAHDTVFTTSSTDGLNTPISIPVPKGTEMLINVPGLHYNPKYWKDPDTFNPERFLGDYNRDAFVPFAAGPRACIGRRFSEIEALTFLANLLLKYKVTATPIEKVETPLETKERLLQWRLGSITLHPVKVPVTFTRRAE